MDLPENYRSFTPPAKQTLTLARKEAERSQHSYVGTGHLFLGMIKLFPDPSSRSVLKRSLSLTALQGTELSLDTISSAVEKQIAARPIPEPKGEIELTPDAKQLFIHAGQESQMLGHRYIGTDHIILGLLREGDCTAARALKSLDVDFERCRKEILSEMPPPSPPSYSYPFFRHRARVAKKKTYAEERPNLKSTPRVAQVLVLAEREKERFQQEHVTAEHLLLGIINLGQCIAVRVLRRMGLNTDAVRVAVEQELMDHPKSKTEDDVPSTPQTETVISLAGQEAWGLNHSYIGTEHILLGILQEGNSIAARTLKDLGMELKQCRNKVCAELDPSI